MVFMGRGTGGGVVSAGILHNRINSNLTFEVILISKKDGNAVPLPAKSAGEGNLLIKLFIQCPKIGHF